MPTRVGMAIPPLGVQQDQRGARSVHHLRRQAQHLCRSLTTEIHASYQRIPCGTVGRALDAAPERMKLGKRQRAVQCLRELSQARQPVGGVDLNVEGRHRLGQRRVQARAHGHAEGSAQEGSQLGGGPPLAGPDQPCEHVAQFRGLDLSDRAGGQLRERATDVQLEDRLRVVVRLPTLQAADVDAEHRRKTAARCVARRGQRRFSSCGLRRIALLQKDSHVVAGAGKPHQLAGLLARFVQGHARRAVGVVVGHSQDVARAIGARVAVPTDPCAGRRAANGEASPAAHTGVGQPHVLLARPGLAGGRIDLACRDHACARTRVSRCPECSRCRSVCCRFSCSSRSRREARRRTAWSAPPAEWSGWSVVVARR